MQEMWVQSLGQKDPLEKGMATHSSVLVWRIPMDRGTWWATVHRVTTSRTGLKQPSAHALNWMALLSDSTQGLGSALWACTGPFAPSCFATWEICRDARALPSLGFSWTHSQVMASVVTGQNLILKLVYILGWENRLWQEVGQDSVEQRGLWTVSAKKRQGFLFIVCLSHVINTSLDLGLWCTGGWFLSLFQGRINAKLHLSLTWPHHEWRG